MKFYHLLKKLIIPPDDIEIDDDSDYYSGETNRERRRKPDSSVVRELIPVEEIDKIERYHKANLEFDYNTVQEMNQRFNMAPKVDVVGPSIVSGKMDIVTIYQTVFIYEKIT